MSHILSEVEGAVGIITIDRPEQFNSLDVETSRDLRKASVLFARDEKVRAVVLRGSEGVFCSGADMKHIRAGGERDSLGYLKPGAFKEGCGEVFKQILEYIHSTISEIRRAPKPFIAAVDGMAVAGGFGLAMSCDLVVASERSSFEWAYARAGLTGAENSTFFLPRLVGLRRAMDMLFLNPRLDAQTARAWGLVTAVYADGAFDAEVAALARQVAALPTEAVGIAKQLMNDAAGMDRLDYHLDREIEHLARIAEGSGFADEVAELFAKRGPQIR